MRIVSLCIQLIQLFKKYNLSNSVKHHKIENYFYDLTSNERPLSFPLSYAREFYGIHKYGMYTTEISLHNKAETKYRFYVSIFQDRSEGE